MGTDVSLNRDGSVTLYIGGKKIQKGTPAEIFAIITNAPKPEPKKEKQRSRAERWADACAKAQDGLQELEELRTEYEDWQSNLPENLSSSALADKLSAVVDLDVQSAIDMVDEASGADLPLGFGRD